MEGNILTSTRLTLAVSFFAIRWSPGKMEAQYLSRAALHSSRSSGAQKMASKDPLSVKKRIVGCLGK
jgi:hypothetical protein